MVDLTWIIDSQKILYTLILVINNFNMMTLIFIIYFRIEYETQLVHGHDTSGSENIK